MKERERKKEMELLINKMETIMKHGRRPFIIPASIPGLLWPDFIASHFRDSYSIEIEE